MHRTGEFILPWSGNKHMDDPDMCWGLCVIWDGIGRGEFSTWTCDTDLIMLECPDLNGEGVVDVGDLKVLLRHWGSGKSEVDFDEDGFVGFIEILQVLSEWGPCPDFNP